MAFSRSCFANQDSRCFPPPAPLTEAEAEPGARGAPSRSRGARGRTSGVQEAAPAARPRATEARCGGGGGSARSRGAGTARLAAVAAANRAPSLPGCSACEALGQRREEVVLWHILRLTSTGGSRQTNSPEFQAGGSPLPRLREAAAKLARYVRLCGSLASNGDSSLLPVALFARSSSSPILHNPPPPPVQVTAFTAGVRAFAWRGLSRPPNFR